MACERCDRLRAHCRATAAARKREFRHQEYWGRPVPGFGDPDARLVIVGLAPAAHGANRTGRMFTGDSSGDWLFEALHRTGFASQPASTGRDDGLTLTDCYIAASARCAPPDNKPTTEELEACRPFLAAELELLTQKRIILVLGRIAWERYLKAAGWWSVLSPRERPPFSHGAESILPDGVTLISSFHPSRQNTNTGRLTREMWHGVFERARALVGRKGGRAEGRKGGRAEGRKEARAGIGVIPSEVEGSAPPSSRLAWGADFRGTRSRSLDSARDDSVRTRGSDDSPEIEPDTG